MFANKKEWYMLWHKWPFENILWKKPVTTLYITWFHLYQDVQIRQIYIELDYRLVVRLVVSELGRQVALVGSW